MYCTKVYSVRVLLLKTIKAFLRYIDEQQICYNSVYIVGTNKNNMRSQIIAVRITEKQKEQINKQAQAMGLNASELVREYIIKLIDYGTGLQNNDSNSKA